MERRQGTSLLVAGGKPAQRPGRARRAATVLYLGEINASQKEQWIRAIEVFDEERGAAEQLKLFAADPGQIFE